MLKLKLQYFGQVMRRANSLEKTLILEKTEGRRRMGKIVKDRETRVENTIALQAPLSIGSLQARILEWVIYPFSGGTYQPRNRTRVSCIAGGFFTSWATQEAHIKSVKKQKWKQAFFESQTVNDRLSTEAQTHISLPNNHGNISPETRPCTQCIPQYICKLIVGSGKPWYFQLWCASNKTNRHTSIHKCLSWQSIDFFMNQFYKLWFFVSHMKNEISQKKLKKRKSAKRLLFSH